MNFASNNLARLLRLNSRAVQGPSADRPRKQKTNIASGLPRVLQIESFTHAISNNFVVRPSHFRTLSHIATTKHARSSLLRSCRGA